MPNKALQQTRTSRAAEFRRSLKDNEKDKAV